MGWQTSQHLFANTGSVLRVVLNEVHGGGQTSHSDDQGWESQGTSRYDTRYMAHDTDNIIILR